MPDTEANKPDTDGTGPHRKPRTRKQRLRRYVLIFLVANILLLVLFRMPFWLTQSRIQALGGCSETAPPPIAFRLANTNTLPSPLRSVCASSAVQWVFSQWPVIVAIDLRGVDDADGIARVLRAHLTTKHVRELVLYGSGVEDHHMKLVRDGFPKLHALKVNDTRITDSGVSELQGHPTLRHLNLQQTLVTDSSIPFFRTMPRLKELNLGGTGITSIESLPNGVPGFFVTTELVTRDRTTDRIRSGR